jgi:hypothetical protein
MLRDLKGQIWVGTTNGLCTGRDGVWKLMPETKRDQAFLALVQAKIGLENEWHFTNIRQARYSKLPPGNYHFEVRTGFDGKTWGPMAVLPFAILPAWWQTWWFTMLVIVFMILLLFAIYYYRVRGLKKRKAELEKLVIARTQELK